MSWLRSREESVRRRGKLSSLTSNLGNSVRRQSSLVFALALTGDADPQAGGTAQIVGGSTVRAGICGSPGQRSGFVGLLRLYEHGSCFLGWRFVGPFSLICSRGAAATA